MSADLRRVSISKAGLLLSGCTTWANPASAWYDESKRPPEDTQKRDDGILFHDIMDLRIKDGNYETTTALPRDVPQLLSHAFKFLDEDLLPRCSRIQSEVAVAVNWTTGERRLLPGIQHRDYPDLGHGWQYGTADIVAVLHDGSLLVADWKTGGTDGAEEQLLTLAVVLQRLFTESFRKTSEHTVQLFRRIRIACIAVNEHGVFPKEREVDIQELNNHADAMCFAWEDIGRVRKPIPGSHCTVLYCPHLAFCSAIHNIVRDCSSGPEAGGQPLVPPEALMRKVTDKPRTDQDYGEQIALVSAAKRQINYIIENAKAHVNDGGKVVTGQFEWKDRGNGFRWGKK